MRYVGVDLAWGERSRTGLAVLDEAGRLLDLQTCRTDEEILDRLRGHTDGPCVVGIDASIVVRNETGQRPCEAALNADFRRYDAGAHPSNMRRPEFADGTRALRLATVLGVDIDPASRADRRALEVYPHPAIVVLFGLERTVKYKHKPGRDLSLLRSESKRLLRLLETLAHADPPLHVGHCAAWRDVVHRIDAAGRKSELRVVEDMVDAVVCGYVALLADQRPERLTTYGDVQTGYIVTPTLDRPATAPRPE